MRSNYKKLGPYIRKVDVRNIDLAVTDLRGLSMTKEFRTSTSNIVGTDMSAYKIVNKWQFACDFMSVIRVFKLPVVLHSEEEPVIVSPAYTVFEITDQSELLPEYLMMWMRRPEFDRYAFFKCDSAIRGGFAWEELCEIGLPVPKPEKQREIVKEYHTIVDRIKLNERLNQKLEETAQAIYKQWFVDFEFPISAEYAASIGKPELKGQPYKSSGGEMVFNEVLKQEIPKGWEDIKWGGIATLEYGKSLKDYRANDGDVPVYGTNGQVGWTTKALWKSEGIIVGRKGVYREVHYCKTPFFVIDTAYYLCPKKQFSMKWAYYELIKFDINNIDSGSAIPSTSREDFYDLKSLLPSIDVQIQFDVMISKINLYKDILKDQTSKLEDLNCLLLARLISTKSDTLGSA